MVCFFLAPSQLRGSFGLVPMGFSIGKKTGNETNVRTPWRVGLAHHGWFGLGFEPGMDTTKKPENSHWFAGKFFMFNRKYIFIHGGFWNCHISFFGGHISNYDTFEDGKVTFDPLWLWQNPQWRRSTWSLKPPRIQVFFPKNPNSFLECY